MKIITEYEQISKWGEIENLKIKIKKRELNGLFHFDIESPQFPLNKPICRLEITHTEVFLYLYTQGLRINSNDGAVVTKKEIQIQIESIDDIIRYDLEIIRLIHFIINKPNKK